MAIVVFASGLDPGLMLEAMRAGVREFVSEPVSQEDFEAAIARVAGERMPVESKGQVIGFVGAKGGVGTTTVAVNTAVALAGLAKNSHCLFVDFHQSGGDAAVFFGVEPKFSILDALENTHRLDSTFLKSIVASAGHNVDLLASPERVATGYLEGSQTRAVIAAAVANYPYTILDLPRSDGALMDALDAVSRIVVVANQELATVKSAARLLAALRKRYPSTNTSIVLSRSDRQADIGFDDIERVTGTRIVHVFPSEYRVALQALNKGRPLVLDNHSDLAGSFRHFAHGLTGTRFEPKPSSRSGLLGRLTQRRV